MKSIFTIFIIFTIALRPLMPLVDYAVNYNFIKNDLCENRQKPQLMCNGKCYLKKELAKTSENQTNTDSHLNISKSVDSFVINETFVFQNLSFGKIEKLIPNSHFTFSYRFSLFSKIFHPPLI